MSNPMTPTPVGAPRERGEVDVEAIRARVDAATPGPWCYTVEGEKVADYSLGVGYSTEGDDFETNLADFQEPDAVEFDERICYRESAEGTNASADFAFIAHARTDIPALLHALQAAREERARVTDEMVEVFCGSFYGSAPWLRERASSHPLSIEWVAEQRSNARRALTAALAASAGEGG